VAEQTVLEVLRQTREQIDEALNDEIADRQLALEGAKTQLDDLIPRAERTEAAIERVRALHEPEQYHDELQPWCTYCNRDDNTRDDVVLWPCPTLAALDTTEMPGGES
jgi:hypothetical protein